MREVEQRVHQGRRGDQRDGQGGLPGEQRGHGEAQDPGERDAEAQQRPEPAQPRDGEHEDHEHAREQRHRGPAHQVDEDVRRPAGGLRQGQHPDPVPRGEDVEVLGRDLDGDGVAVGGLGEQRRPGRRVGEQVGVGDGDDLVRRALGRRVERRHVAVRPQPHQPGEGQRTRDRQQHDDHHAGAPPDREVGGVAARVVAVGVHARDQAPSSRCAR